MTSRSSDLIYWVTERYEMKRRRDRQSQPTWRHGWSDDPTMGLTRWCNVHREDDKVTKWLAEHWRPGHHQVWEMVLARMINYIPSLIRIKIEGLENASAALHYLRQEGHKIFTSAYTISTCGQRMDKIDYVMGVVQSVKIGWDHWGPLDNTLVAWHKRMQQVNGLGSFLAAQVIADLKNTKGHPLATAPDWLAFSAPGPGSLRGLSAYFDTSVTPHNYQVMIKKAYDEVIQEVYDRGVPLIHMQDFQNCMCEFSKFMKISQGKGHARNRYSAR